MSFKFFSKFLKAPKKRRTQVIRSEGKHHNLQDVYERVNQRYFEGKLSLQITWFTPRKKQYRSRVLLGSFHRQTQLIKINRLLDEVDVPPYFVDFVVYHEMLHHVLPPLQRRCHEKRIHHREFREREKAFDAYHLAQAYQHDSKVRWFGGLKFTR